MLKHAVNPINILVNHLCILLGKQTEIPDSQSIVPAHYLGLLLKFAQSLDSCTKVDFMVIKEHANTITTEHVDKLKMILENDKNSTPIMTLLNNYSKGHIVKTPNEIYELGLDSYKQKKYSEATNYFEAALLNIPMNTSEAATCYYFIPAGYLAQDKYEEAKKAAHESFSLREDLAIKRVVTAEDVSHSKKKLTAASKLCEGEQFAKDGLNHFKLQNYSSAIDSLKQAIGKHSAVYVQSLRFSTYHYNLASSFDRHGDNQLACHHVRISYEMRRGILGDNSEDTKKAFDKLNLLSGKTTSPEKTPDFAVPEMK